MNTHHDTTMGGTDSDFPQTWWSSVLHARPEDTDAIQERLREVFTHYWRPVYRFVRSSGHEVEDAKDLTQEFFCHLLQRDFLERYKPSVGRFRTFLKGALRNFLAEQGRDSRRLKRGGDVNIIPIDVAQADDPEAVTDPKASSADQVFDRQWAEDVMAQAVSQLHREYLDTGREPLFRVFEAHDLRAGSAPSYAESAERFGLTVAQIRHALEDARSRLQELVRLTLSEYVSTRDELITEMRELYL